MKLTIKHIIPRKPKPMTMMMVKAVWFFLSHPFFLKKNLEKNSTDIRIVTKEIYDGSTRNWTNRAGSFLEQSRAFFDSYLGRWDRGNQSSINDEDRDDSVPENGEECTSATSGEEIWGTPTSGENDEIQMFNSDQTVCVQH